MPNAKDPVSNKNRKGVFPCSAWGGLTQANVKLRLTCIKEDT